MCVCAYRRSHSICIPKINEVYCGTSKAKWEEERQSAGQIEWGNLHISSSNCTRNRLTMTLNHWCSASRCPTTAYAKLIHIHNAMNKANDLSTDRSIDWSVDCYYWIHLLRCCCCCFSSHFFFRSLASQKHMRNKFKWNYCLNQAAKRSDWCDRFCFAMAAWRQTKQSTAHVLRLLTKLQQ